MDTVIHKLFAVILVVLGLALTPLINSTIIDDSRAQRLELNYTQNYLDIICDKGVISEEDYTDYATSLSSTGYLYKIDVELESRRVYVPTNTSSNTLATYHVLSTVFTSDTGGVKNAVYVDPVSGVTTTTPNVLGRGDIVTVRISKIQQSRTSKVFATIFHLFVTPKDISLKGMVRNDG